jgi:hypothetical protein
MDRNTGHKDISPYTNQFKIKNKFNKYDKMNRNVKRSVDDFENLCTNHRYSRISIVATDFKQPQQSKNRIDESIVMLLNRVNQIYHMTNHN